MTVAGYTEMGATPVPVNDVVCEVPGAATAISSWPLFAPAEYGRNAILIEQFVPCAKVKGVWQLPVPATLIQPLGTKIDWIVRLANGLVLVTVIV